MRHKTYTTSPQKTKKIICTVDMNSVGIPNPELLNARLKNKAVTFADRRYKQPKHKNKIFEADT